MADTLEFSKGDEQPLMQGEAAAHDEHGEELEEMAIQYETSKFTESMISTDLKKIVEEGEAPVEMRRFEANIEYDQKNLARKFKGNQISTAKYSCLTFLPLNLFNQFTKMANVYFLILTLMELIPAINSPGGFATMLMPLCFVVSVSMVKDFFEDRKRHKSDDEENNAPVEFVPRGGKAFKTGKCREIQVGCIVRVKEDQMFPCDMYLLNSAIPKGICYVETKNLDGETNLKHKQANQLLYKQAYNEEAVLMNFTDAKIECEMPNEFIYNFDGIMTQPVSELQVPMTPDNFLLRGCALRNCEWVYGICVFTGHDTKAMLNSAKSRQKRSKMELATNKYIVVTIVIQIALALFAGFYNSLYTYNFGQDANAYLLYDNTANWITMGLVQTGTWFLLMMNFVSISLLVTLEMVKFIQAQFITWDHMIYDTEKDQESKVQSSNLNEELGMIHYIFSDKTGTLTQNIMEFKKCSIGPTTYGTKDPRKQNYAPGVTNVNFDDDDFFAQLKDSTHENHENINLYIQCLGLCHTVICENKTTDQGQNYINYNASSPDELALVNAARFWGFAFKERDEHSNMVIENSNNGQTEKYELLNVIEFDSARKRMTVIVRCPDKRIMVICKGADSIIEKRLTPGQDLLGQTTKYLEEYANEGLRTLLIAYKYVDPSFYDVWNKKFQKAMLQTNNKEKAINDVAEEIEIDFTLIGSTAIEDKLQDEVGKTIADIKKAGIQVWVLTGDKIETAINIGYSCELLTNDMNMFILEEKKANRITLQLADYTSKQSVTFQHRANAVIVAGETLSVIQEDENLSHDFINLCEKANVVLACRVSPKQKAEVVAMVMKKHPDRSSLAIGDGANDVNMITTAHIGVGISGLEGAQAARSADYAIGQFKFLKSLLFVHGREAYRRNAYLISYMFYKNVIYVVPIWMFGWYSMFSGQAIYSNVLYSFYNVCFTALPIIWFAVFDWEYSKEELLNSPSLYRCGLEDVFFDKTTFWRWFFYAVWQGIALLAISFETMSGANDGADQMGELPVQGNFIFCALVILVNVKVLISSFQQTFWIGFWVIGSIGTFFPIYAAVSYYGNYPNAGAFYHMFTAGQIYSLIAFFMTSFILIDNGVQMANAEMRNYMYRYNVFKKRAEKEKAKQKSHVIKKKVAEYSHRGFAYSGEAGNDTMVTAQLENRLQDALRKQLFAKGSFGKLQKASITRSQSDLSLDTDEVPIMQKPNPLAPLAAILQQKREEEERKKNEGIQ